MLNWRLAEVVKAMHWNLSRKSECIFRQQKLEEDLWDGYCKIHLIQTLEELKGQRNNIRRHLVLSLDWTL